MPRSLKRLAERVFVLNCLEFVVFVLRGDRRRCPKLLDTGLSALIEACPPGLAEMETLMALEAVAHEQESADLCDELQAEYARLFNNENGEAATPLQQSCHEGQDAKAGERMTQRLTRWGLEPEAGQTADHVAYQLELLHVLLGTYWSDKSTGAGPAAMELARDLLSWLPGLQRKVQTAAPDSVHSLTVTLAVQACSAVAEQDWPQT